MELLKSARENRLRALDRLETRRNTGLRDDCDTPEPDSGRPILKTVRDGVAMRSAAFKTYLLK